MAKEQEQDVSAMDMETQGFKVWRQVPVVWLYVTFFFTFLSIVVGIIAIALGAVAITTANDNEDRLNILEPKILEAELQPTQSEQPSSILQSADSEASAPQLPAELSDTAAGANAGIAALLAHPSCIPGEDFDGFHHQPFFGARTQTFDVVVHGSKTDPFWLAFQQGLCDAASLFRANFNYKQVPDSKIESMGPLIEQARFGLRDGVAITIPDSDILEDSIKLAAEEIPVMSVTTGAESFSRLGLFTHVGQTDEEAGRRAGLQMAAARVNKTICLIQNVTRCIGVSSQRSDAVARNCNDLSPQRRCDGLKDGLGEDNVIEVLVDSGEDVAARLLQELDADPTINGVLALNPEGFAQARDALKDREVCSGTNPSPNCTVFGTFEATDDILNAIIDGNLTFALDQQPYLQGYLAIGFMTIKSFFGFEAGAGSAVMTGPNIIADPVRAREILDSDFLTGKTIKNISALNSDFRYIVHGKPNDPFWDVVKSGVKIAAQNFGVQVDYRQPPVNMDDMDDIVDFMKDRLDEAVGDDVDGIVLTIPRDDNALKIKVLDAQGKKIPIVSINAGTQLFEDFGIQAHIGQDDFTAGRMFGMRLAENGVSNAICLVHEATDDVLRARCEGLADALLNNDAESTVLVLDSSGDENFTASSPTVQDAMREEIIDFLNDDFSIDAVVALGPIGTTPAEAAIAAGNRTCQGGNTPAQSSCVGLAAFDSGVAVTLIEEDKILFASDEQQGLQGYMPLMFLALEQMWGIRPVGVLNTGPSFIDRTNVEQVKDLEGFNIR